MYEARMAAAMIVPQLLVSRGISAAPNRESAMIRHQAFVALAIATAMGALSATSADASFFGGRHHRGGYVIPCSLDGVNPVDHPDIFGNPAAAFREFGFVLGPDRSWHVVSNCVRGLNHN
jgi:hypothetical protein